jgi:dienelactone hydrolase
MKNYILIFSLIVFSFGCDSAEPVESVNTNRITPDSVAAPAGTDGLESAAQPASVGIQFVSAGSATIKGTFYKSAVENSPAVLLLHQWQSDRKSYDAFAKLLQSKGIGVLSVDGRGFGESVKTTDGKTLSADRSDESVEAMKTDVDNAFLLLADQPNVDPERIGIVGASYGSSLAIIYGAGNKKVKAVALLSPGMNYFGNMPTEPAVKAYGERALLLVAAKDDRASAESVEKLKMAGDNTKYEIKVYEKGGHGTNLFAAKVGMEELLLGFLSKSLK